MTISTIIQKIAAAAGLSATEQSELDSALENSVVGFGWLNDIINRNSPLRLHAGGFVSGTGQDPDADSTDFTGTFLLSPPILLSNGDYADIGGFNAGTIEWYGNSTTGKLYAGGGEVFMDANGVTIVAAATQYLTTNSYKFVDTDGNTSGVLAARFDSSFNAVRLYVPAIASKDSDLDLLASAPSGQVAEISLTAAVSGKTSAVVELQQAADGTAVLSVGANGGAPFTVRIYGVLNMQSNLINGVSDPVSAQDAATKNYVDAAINDFDIKLAVRAASQANLAFTRSGNVYTANALGVLLRATIDSGWSTGAALSVGDRILLANQTSNVDNGIVTVTSLGAIGLFATLTRATDMDASAEVTSEMRVPVTEGTDANLDYKLSSAGPFTLNTTALPFTKAGGPPTGAAGGELAGTYPNPTLTNASVIAKVLTGFSSGAGTVAATDTILQAFQKVVGNIAVSLSTTLGAQKSGLSVSGQTLSLAPNGWTEANETWTRVSASTFTCPTDQTARYKKGTFLWWTDNGASHYGTCAIDSTVSVGVTTVTILVNTDHVIGTGGITANFYSYDASPLGWPMWFSRTVTGIVTGSGGSAGTYAQDATSMAVYATIGNMMFDNVSLKITNKGSWTGDLRVAAVATPASPFTTLPDWGGGIFANAAVTSKAMAANASGLFQFLKTYPTAYEQWTDVAVNDWINIQYIYKF